MRWIATALIAIAGLSCIIAGLFVANLDLHPGATDKVLSVAAVCVVATTAAILAARRALAVPAKALWPLWLFLGLCFVCGSIYGQLDYRQGIKLLALFLVLLAGGLWSARLINRQLSSAG